MLGGALELKGALEKKIDEGVCYVYGIDIFNKIIGRVCLTTESENKKLADGETICYLSHLYVNRYFRGRGIGSKLVNHTVDNAKKLGFKYLTLMVDAENEKNVNLYKKLGFTTCIGRFTKTVNENGKDVIEKHMILKKDLQEE
jgi:phosphinothricin acetyltransferase